MLAGRAVAYYRCRFKPPLLSHSSPVLRARSSGAAIMALSSYSTFSNAGSLSQRLWREQAPMARAVLHHPFVRGIGQGTLDDDLFRGYAAQDAHFLKAFAKAYAHALTKAEDAHTIAELSGCIASVVEELELHSSLGVAHHVTEGSDTSPPSPACEAYTSFLLKVAGDAFSTVAQVLAAMCPCMRLYAYLAKTLQRKLPNASRRESLQAWISTYASPGFEEAAAKVEALLDREYGKTARSCPAGDQAAQVAGEKKEAEPVRRLQELYARAMVLEFDFFAEHWRPHGEGDAPGPWRGIDPVMAIYGFQTTGLLVTDFDSTCSREDTTHVLAKAAEHFKGPNYSAARWSALEQAYLSNLSQVLPPLLEPPDAAARDRALADPKAHLAPLDAFEAQAVDSVSDSGVLAGIAMDALPALLQGPLAPHLALQAHCSAVLRYAEARAAAVYVLSVSWCADLIASATGLSRETIICNSLEADASTGLSTGVVRVAVDGPGGKHRHFRALSARHGPQARPSIFIGDSITDLLALQAADVGLIVGQSQRLRQMAMTLGCEVAPLVAYPINGERGLEGKRVLYEAEDWSEIMAALFGVYGARYLMTAPRSEP